MLPFALVLYGNGTMGRIAKVGKFRYPSRNSRCPVTHKWFPCSPRNQVAAALQAAVLLAAGAGRL